MKPQTTQESSFEFAVSLAFMLPVSTQPNAITYSSGHIPITKMIKAGVILDIIGV